MPHGMQRGRIAAVAARLAAALALVSGCDAADPPSHPSDREARVRAACSACHAFTPPEILPREMWRAQVERMAGQARYLPESLGGPAVDFDVKEVTEWFESRAPEALPPRRVLTRDGPSPLRFERRRVLLGPGSGPGVATVAALASELVTGPGPFLSAPNMITGRLHLFSLRRGPQLVGEAGHPVRALGADLDADGLEDLLISDLGHPMPTDDLVGRVLAARNRGDGTFSIETLLEGVGRVADARAADLDADGDLDVVVAAFGFLRSGGIHLLVNEGGPGAALRFRAERVSDRPGAVSVIPVEGLRAGSGPGFVVAFAQHYEWVAHFRRAESGYREEVLYRAPHPNWGTSNLEAVDLEGDGDLDFLLSHGDTLDDGLAFKPYHGVEWLENTGDGDLRARPIGPLYGAHRAEAADLDGDGDLDVVASAFLPQVELPVPQGALRVDSLVWFERRGDEWIPWSIEADHPRHTGMTVADVDADGRPDVVAAINSAWDAEPGATGPALEVWLNRGPPELDTPP